MRSPSILKASEVIPAATSGEESGQRIMIVEKIMNEDQQNECQGKFWRILRELDAVE